MSSALARSARRLVSIAVTAIVLASTLTVAPAFAATEDLARAGTMTASASQSDVDGTFPVAHAGDADPSTRWASGNGPDADVPFTQWLQVDLGGEASVERVDIDWERAFARTYEIQVATADPQSESSWSTVHTQNDSDGGRDDIPLASATTARYVRVLMTQRAAVEWEPGVPHWYGYSLYSLEVHGTRTTTLPAVPSSPSEVSDVRVLDDFESGVPAEYRTWAIRDDLRPVLNGGEGASPDSRGLEAAASAPNQGEWLGFAHDMPVSDWSDHDGFAFWFQGTGSGGTLRYELKSGGELFETRVVDDAPGWRRISVEFSALRLKDDEAAEARFDPSAATGFAVTLSDLGAGTWRFDDFGLYTRTLTIDDAEGDVPLAQGDKVGLFPWQGEGASVDLRVEAMDRSGAPAGNDTLAGSYDVPASSWGGFSHNLAAAADWSSFRGIRLWWYASQENNPASPTAGETITLELKDGGADGEAAEKWTATFLDRWGSSTSRWKLVEIPFDQFTLSADEQDGVLDLTAAWGYAVKFPSAPAAALGYAIDDVQLYGSARAAASATVSATDIALVAPGEVASVPVTVTTKDGGPLAQDLVVRFTDLAGSAEPSTHYIAVSGELAFPAGTPSGETRTIDVQTKATADEDVSRALTLNLSSSGADLGPDPRIVLNAVGMPYLDPTLPVEQRVQDLLARMTLAEKVGQMAQAERLGLASVDEIADLGLGSLLSGGGSVPEDNTVSGWADMVDLYQRQALSTRLQIPLVYGVDAVHGHNNLVGATIFPHNQSLGATRDPSLVEAIGSATAEEVRATGIPWTFAACLCVTRDERWGRSYESFGEDPALVRMFSAATVQGLQGTDPADMSGAGKVLSTAKHWLGDGGTTYVQGATGYPIDQGVTEVSSREELLQLFAEPYIPAIAAGVGSIMPSYSAVSINGAEPVRMHEYSELNNDLLKGDYGFDGFVVSDWEALDKLPGGTFSDKAARAVNAGVDMAMTPYNYGEFISAVTSHVEAGTISAARIDDAVSRILRQKFALGLFEQPLAERSEEQIVGSADHRALARKAAAQSQVLLKNSDAVLPLAKDASIYVAGSNADDVGHQSGGWTVSWQGGSGDTTTGTSILEGIREVAPSAQLTYSADASAPVGDAAVGIVVVGERPYAEGVGDAGTNGFSLELPEGDRNAIDKVCSQVEECVVLVVSGRPQIVTGQLGVMDALVASWLPGSEGAGVADVLFGDRPFTGRLPVTWPADASQVPINVGDAAYDPAFAFGWGIRTDDARARTAEAAALLPDGDAKSAVLALHDADVWTEDGQLQVSPQSWDRVVAAAGQLHGADDRSVAMAAGLVVSVVRDLAQQSIVGGESVPPDADSLTAQSEQRLLAGDPTEAVTLLAKIPGVSP